MKNKIVKADLILECADSIMRYDESGRFKRPDEETRQNILEILKVIVERLPNYNERLYEIALNLAATELQNGCNSPEGECGDSCYECWKTYLLDRAREKLKESERNERK